MPRYGGFSPYPLRYGGGEGGSGKTILQRVFESMASQRGSAYDQTTASAVGVENMAIARSLTFDGYGANQRLSNSFLPQKATLASGMLQRWEAVFGAPPMIGDTELARQNRVAAAWAKVGQPNTHQPIVDALTKTLGPVFTGTIVYQTPATALVYWPGGNSATPTLPWLSTIGHIDVQLTLPTGYSIAAGTPNALFWNAAGSLVQVLDPMLPAWITFDWFLASSHGGPGFWLDDFNLDLEIFDV